MFNSAYIQGERLGAALVLVLLSLLVATASKAAPRADLIEFWDDNEPASTMQINHSIWQELLTAYVDDNHPSGISRFDYAAVSADDALRLKNYLDYLEKMEPRQLNQPEAMAFWINMFNAILVDRVLDDFQSGSEGKINRLISGSGLRNVGWGRDTAEIAMQEISLNDIEHGILRPIWNDPRIHFVITACTLGGGSIRKTAYTGENIEELLETSKNEFLRHPRGVRVDGNRVILSSIFDWYRSDFAENKNTLLAYVRENTSDELRQAMQGLTRVSFDYDWGLNSPDNQLELE